VNGVAVTGIGVSEEDFDAETLAAWVALGQTRNVLLLWHAQIDGIRDNMTGGTNFAVIWFIVDRSKITGLAIRGRSNAFRTFKRTQAQAKK